jgi:cadmium resistance protein CadD (predicted permease)
MNKMTGKLLLILAACANCAIALVHIAIPLIGVNGYIYFGTMELAQLAAAGSPIPAIATWFLALVFAGFGFYCLSGAGTVRRLPLLTLALWFIGGIYTLRGLILILDIQRFLSGVIYPLRQPFFSTVALVIGLMVLVGKNSKA